MRIEILKNLTEHQTKEIDVLWNEVYPIKLKNRFGLLLNGIKEYQHHVLLNESEEVIGWAVAYLRNDEIWFSIIISTANQNKGYGKMLIESLKQNFSNLCGWVIDHNNDLKQDGSTYCTPKQFYQKNGFIITKERIESDILSAVKITFEA
ncbi:GNAT superfamily N-acetyltransferase [Pedobacter sp. CG_S7]|uniref:GNAT family N-acetyltransferase n=1 Tax=Pedobacter sp. CG_S7 TaxID=3143930 RepID=UPI0033973E93